MRLPARPGADDADAVFGKQFPAGDAEQARLPILADAA